MPRRGQKREKRKEQSSDFQAPLPPKRFLAAHMDPNREAAKAKIYAIIGMQKNKSDTGSKGSWVTSTKAPTKGLEEASTTGSPEGKAA